MTESKMPYVEHTTHIEVELWRSGHDDPLSWAGPVFDEPESANSTVIDELVSAFEFWQGRRGHDDAQLKAGDKIVIEIVGPKL